MTKLRTLFLLFALVNSSLASDVLNAPEGDYMVIDGRIINFTNSQGGTDFGFGLGYAFPTYAEAVQVDEYIRSHVSASNLEFNGYKGAHELRNGQQNIIGGYIILVSEEYSSEDYDGILNAVRSCGYNVQDSMVSFFDQGSAEIQENLTDDDSPILERLDYISNMLNWLFFVQSVIWGSLLYIAFMQKG